MTITAINLPEQVQHGLSRTLREMNRDAKLYAALLLHQLGKWSNGMAAQMAGISRMGFCICFCVWLDRPRVLLGIKVIEDFLAHAAPVQ
jgi:hypothetical protein